MVKLKQQWPYFILGMLFVLLLSWVETWETVLLKKHRKDTDEDMFEEKENELLGKKKKITTTSVANDDNDDVDTEGHLSNEAKNMVDAFEKNTVLNNNFDYSKLDQASGGRIFELSPTKGKIVSLVKVPGVLPFTYQSKKTTAKSWEDLPRIYPNDPADYESKSTKLSEKKKVCVINRTPRQRSLFTTNVISMFGSGKYNYVSVDSTNCQHYGTCRNISEARFNPQCNPDTDPMVYMIERIKCCQHDRFDKVLESGKKYYDVMIASGDEYCRGLKGDGNAHFRFYYGPNVVQRESLPTMESILRGEIQTQNLSAPMFSLPLFLPLGPREEFRRVKPKHLILAPDRKYLFNFAGSLTSYSRRRLGEELLRIHVPNTVSFTHITAEWSKELTQKNGYLLPSDYRKVVLNSTFTLCPQGHNPEAYRIFEACEAGSIPILTLDSSYQLHECRHAFLPLIKAGAPFVFLNGWKGLGAFLKRVAKDRDLLLRMQINVMEWYAKYMKSMAQSFEKTLEARFQERIGDIQEQNIF